MRLPTTKTWWCLPLRHQVSTVNTKHFLCLLWPYPNCEKDNQIPAPRCCQDGIVIVRLIYYVCTTLRKVMQFQKSCICFVIDCFHLKRPSLESMITFVLSVDFGFKAYVIRYKSLSCSSKWHVVLNSFWLFPSFNSLGMPAQFGCSVYVFFQKPFCQRNVSLQTIGCNIPSLQGNVSFGMMDEIFPIIVCT